MKIKELLAMDIDIDVYENVTEDIGIAFCGAMSLTEEGIKKFGDVLEYEATILEDPMGYDVCIITTDDDPNIPWQTKAKRAKLLFYSLAGYCSCEDYDRWFKEID